MPRLRCCRVTPDHQGLCPAEARASGSLARAEAAGYRRYVDFVSRLYRLQVREFIDRNIDSPLKLMTPALARLVAMGGFRRLAPIHYSYHKTKLFVQR